MRIIWVPLEPLEERYTKDWAWQFPSEFQRCGVEVRTIAGRSLTEGIETGDVLDAYGTNYWKASQLMHLAELWTTFGPDDVVFFADLWFPGVEMLQYMRAWNPAPRIVGVLHAGTWDKTDFTVRRGMRGWGQHFEEMLFSFLDQAFVATHYHRDMIVRTVERDVRDRVVVTGLPFYREPFKKLARRERDNIVVFPHRLDPEKRPELFDAMAHALRPQFPDVRFIKTQDQENRRKKAYYNLLSRAKVAVSFAEHEMWGYGMLEATALGCIPVMPNCLSYKELYPLRYLYEGNGAATLVAQALQGDLLPPDVDEIAVGSEAAIENMIDVCRGLVSGGSSKRLTR